MTGPTRYVESDDDYQRPETAASRMRDRLRRQPRVDAHGFPLPTATDPTVTDVVGGPDPITPVVPPQGGPATLSGSHTPVPAPGTPGSLLDRMHAKAAQQLAQPTPPGSAVV